MVARGVVTGVNTRASAYRGSGEHPADARQGISKAA